MIFATIKVVKSWDLAQVKWSFGGLFGVFQMLSFTKMICAFLFYCVFITGSLFLFHLQIVILVLKVCTCFVHIFYTICTV
jgi:hypothetical protein